MPLNLIASVSSLGTMTPVESSCLRLNSRSSEPQRKARQLPKMLWIGRRTERANQADAMLSLVLSSVEADFRVLLRAPRRFAAQVRLTDILDCSGFRRFWVWDVHGDLACSGPLLVSFFFFRLSIDKLPLLPPPKASFPPPRYSDSTISRQNELLVALLYTIASVAISSKLSQRDGACVQKVGVA